MNWIKKYVTVGLAMVSFATSANPCQAFFNLFQPRYTTAAPPTYPAYCNCPQTVQYTPQTCYHTQVTNVPVTTCRPVSVIDPCTGCLQTIVQPTTSYVQQVRYIPYQSFRIVQRPTMVAAPAVVTAASPCCGAAAPAPAYAASPAMPSGCSTCGVGATYAPAMAAPSLGMPMGAAIPQIPTAIAPSWPAETTTTYGTSAATSAVQPAPSLSPVIIRMPTTSVERTTVTSPSVTGATATGATIETKSPTTPAPESKLTPIPDIRFSPPSQPAGGAPSTRTPGLIDPNSRTTMRTVPGAWASSLVSWPAPKSSDNDWRPSSR